MKLNARELPLLLLPGLGLLAFGLTLKPASNEPPPSPTPTFPVYAAPTAPLPTPTAESIFEPGIGESLPAYISIEKPQAKRGTGDEVHMRATLNLLRNPAGRPYALWYYNRRIEGTLSGHSHVFYASDGQNPYSCLSFSSANSIDHMSSHGVDSLSSEVQQAFYIGHLPSDARDLVFTLEAVALYGVPAPPREVSRAELARVIHCKQRIGYAINSVRISLAEPKSLAHVLPLPTVTPGALNIQPREYLQIEPRQDLP